MTNMKYFGAYLMVVVCVAGKSLAGDERPYVVSNIVDAVKPIKDALPEIPKPVVVPLEDNNMPLPGFRGFSTSEVNGPDGYQTHFEQFLINPKVRYVVADVKVKYYTHMRDHFASLINDNEPQGNFGQQDDEVESETAKQIKADFGVCLMAKRDLKVPVKEAAMYCGSQLWQQSQQKFLEMETALKQK